jgi:hypothetical protein
MRASVPDRWRSVLSVHSVCVTLRSTDHSAEVGMQLQGLAGRVADVHVRNSFNAKIDEIDAIIRSIREAVSRSIPLLHQPRD